MTTMEGGMITTNNKKIRDYAISMRNQGKGKKKFWMLSHRYGQ